MYICTSSPNTMEFFKQVAIRSADLNDYDDLKLVSTRNQRRVAESVADRVIDCLHGRRDYGGQAIRHGSFLRLTNLAKPGISDVDVIAFISEDYNGNELSSIDDFEDLRNDASQNIKDHLMNNLNDCFATVELDEFWKGLCIKLRVKNHWSARHFWNVDVIIAYDASQDAQSRIAAYKSLRGMTISQKTINTNAFSICRNIFVEEIYQVNPRLRTLVRLLKCFNWISKEKGNCEKGVSSVVVEMLVILLYMKCTIPCNFGLNRALCTCLEHIGYPRSRNDVWITVDDFLYPEDAVGVPHKPTDFQLWQMRENCGADGLIVVDPFAPFSNLAVRKRRIVQAWEALTEDAQDVFQYLKRNGVAPYQ